METAGTKSGLRLCGRGHSSARTGLPIDAGGRRNHLQRGRGWDGTRDEDTAAAERVIVMTDASLCARARGV